MKSKRVDPSFEDPIRLFLRGVRKVHSLWLSWTYPFASVGRRFSVHYSCRISRRVAGFMKIGDNVLIEPNSRVDVPVLPRKNDPVIILDSGCQIGMGATILAINRIYVGRGAIFGPYVLLMDHNHEFRDVTIPILSQGTTPGGTIRVEEGCWIGFGAAVVCDKGELVIGKNSVIGANAVVTRSVPPYSVVSGNPGRIVKQFDPSKGQWVIGGSGLGSNA